MIENSQRKNADSDRLQKIADLLEKSWRQISEAMRNPIWQAYTEIETTAALIQLNLDEPKLGRRRESGFRGILIRK